MRRIKLYSPKYGNRYAIVDDSDYDRIIKFKWSLKKSYRTFYARRRSQNPTWILMHREVLMLLPTGPNVDHKSRNGLDNRRCNLRDASLSQNGANRSKLDNCSSIYKGVCYIPKRKKYRAAIQKNKKVIFLGEFDSETQAAKAYDQAAVKHHGEFANINFK